MQIDIEELRERVKAGINFLDDKAPHYWRQLVYVPALDSGNGLTCVLGQVCGSYLAGLYELGLNYAEAVSLGFTLSIYHSDETWDALTEIWIEALSR